MRKQFTYIIADPCFRKAINVDTTECQTVQDLKHLISSFINQAEDQFTIYNASSEQLLSSIENNYEFYIIFYKSNLNLNIIFPNENEFTIYNSFNMTFDDIFKYIQEDQSLYYSNMCIEQIDLFVWDIPLPKNGKHLSNIPNDVKIRVQINANTISLIYDQKAFIFLVYEPFVDAKEFIEKVLGPNVEISIRCISDNKLLQNDDVLVDDKRYEINAICNFSFELANIRFDHKMDYFSTVLSAKQFIRMQYGNNRQINSEIEIICSNDAGEIIDDNVRLSILNKYGPIHFSIRTNPDELILINFIFDDENIDKYDNFYYVFERDFSIGAISCIISDRYSINDKIVLMYKGRFSKIDIDGSATLDDISHLISEIDQDGDINNILYVKIIKKNTEPIQQLNNIVSNDINNNNNSNDDNNNNNSNDDNNNNNSNDNNNNNNNNNENINDNANEDEIRIIETDVNTVEIEENIEQCCEQQHDNEPQENDEQELNRKSNVENAFNTEINNFFINALDTDLIQKIQPQLRMKRLLGNGATSKVYKVTHINKNFHYDKDESKIYSLKVFNKDLIIIPRTCQTSENDDDFEEEEESNEFDLDDEKVKNILKEYELSARINHPNIIKSFSIYFGDNQYPPCILFEYAPSSLDKCIPVTRKSPIKLEYVDLIIIIYEICQAMNCLHKLNLIHRDLKPSNILISEDKHAKICDFGIAKCFSLDSITYTYEIGTWKYIAPEILYQDTHYDEKVDVFSFGVVLHFILSNGNLPLIKPQERVTLSPKINNVSKQLILQCLSINPSERLSFEQIINFIEENHFMLFDGIEDKLSLIHERLGK